MRHDVSVSVRRHRAAAAASDVGGAEGPGDAGSAWQYRRDTSKQMLRFMGPALLLPLADPLMSLVDTVCIGQARACWREERGSQQLQFVSVALVHLRPHRALLLTQFAGTLELASLGPSTFVFSFFSYIFNALGIATIACVAASLKEGDRQRASRTASAAFAIALVCGLGSTVIMQARRGQSVAVLCCAVL